MRQKVSCVWLSYVQLVGTAFRSIAALVYPGYFGHLGGMRSMPGLKCLHSKNVAIRSMPLPRHSFLLASLALRVAQASLPGATSDQLSRTGRRVPIMLRRIRRIRSELDHMSYKVIEGSPCSDRVNIAKTSRGLAEACRTRPTLGENAVRSHLVRFFGAWSKGPGPRPPTLLVGGNSDHPGEGWKIGVQRRISSPLFSQESYLRHDC